MHKTSSNFKLNWSLLSSPPESLVKPWRWTFAIRAADLEQCHLVLNRQKYYADLGARVVVFAACAHRGMKN